MLIRVAQHLFEIVLPDSLRVNLYNYAPFSVFEAEKGEPLLFSLRVADEPMPEWTELRHVFTDTSDDDMPRIEVYRIGEDWLLKYSITKTSNPVACFRTNSDFSKAVLYISEPRQAKFAIDNAAMLLFAFSSAKHRTLEMHASVSVRNRKGYLFLGHSGTGKSTHSRQWLAEWSDCTLLNDDNPVIRLLDNEDGTTTAWIFGSPWSGKTPCYRNEAYPIGGIVKLNQAPMNTPRMLRLPEAYAYVLSSASGLKIVPEMMDALYATIASLIQSVKCLHLDCLPNRDAAKVCYEALNNE